MPVGGGKEQGVIGITTTRKPGEIVSAPPVEKKAPPASPDSKKTEPPKKPLVQRLIRTLAARIILGGLIVTGAGYAGIKVYENVPASHQNAETASPFDNGKLDTQRQTIIFGKNAQEATDKKMNDFIESPLPELNSQPKTLGDLSTISIILSMGLEEAGEVKVWRTSTGILIGKETIPAPVNTYVSTENLNVPWGIPIIKGVNVDEVEIFKVLDTNSIYEKFKLGNDKYIVINIHGTFAASDKIIGAPTINTKAPPKSGINYIQDVLQETGLQLKRSDNPTLIDSRGKDVVMNGAFIDGSKGTSVPIVFEVQNGNLVFSTPR